jgi:hypothetical protein
MAWNVWKMVRLMKIMKIRVVGGGLGIITLGLEYCRSPITETLSFFGPGVEF